jgi:hypothetical protein
MEVEEVVWDDWGSEVRRAVVVVVVVVIVGVDVRWRGVE